jgi:hypothetical protein
MTRVPAPGPRYCSLNSHSTACNDQEQRLELDPERAPGRRTLRMQVTRHSGVCPSVGFSRGEMVYPPRTCATTGRFHHPRPTRPARRAAATRGPPGAAPLLPPPPPPRRSSAGSHAKSHANRAPSAANGRRHAGTCRGGGGSAGGGPLREGGLAGSSSSAAGSSSMLLNSTTFTPESSAWLTRSTTASRGAHRRRAMPVASTQMRRTWRSGLPSTSSISEAGPRMVTWLPMSMSSARHSSGVPWAAREGGGASDGGRWRERPRHGLGRRHKLLPRRAGHCMPTPSAHAPSRACRPALEERIPPPSPVHATAHNAKPTRTTTPATQAPTLTMLEAIYSPSSWCL